MTQKVFNRRQTEALSPKRRRYPWWLGIGLILLGVGASAVTILGPLVTGVIEYHASEGAANQIAVGDAAVLLLMAPVSIDPARLPATSRPTRSTTGRPARRRLRGPC